MKLTARLFLTVTEWAIICRGSIWDSFEHAHDALLDSWSDESNQELMEGIHHQLTPTDAYHPYAPSHTLTTNVHTPGRSNSGVPDHFMMEDHFITPVHNSLEKTPVDDTFFEGLPTTDDKFPNYLLTIGRAGREARKTTTDKRAGLATSSNHVVMSSITKEKEKVSLLDRIQIRMEETRVHQLVFHEHVLNIPESSNPQHPGRKQIFQEIWLKRQVESRTHLAGLVVKHNELSEFVDDFNKFRLRGGYGCTEPAFPSDIASRELTVFYNDYLETWMDVYHRRLGINFEAFDKWAIKILSQAFIKTSKSTKKSMRGHFVSYIFLVDTIITILPERSDQLVDRIQAFRTAVACFEQHTEERIAREQFTPPILRQKLQFLWSYLEYWLSQDQYYSSNTLLWLPDKSGFEMRDVWKGIFNRIFAHSIQSLTIEKTLELAQKK
jgi:hypothetical protein